MKHLFVALALSIAITAPVYATDISQYDFSQFIIVNNTGEEVDLNEKIVEEIQVEKEIEKDIAEFWDITLKDGATKEQIEAVKDKIPKVCYMPKRDEYTAITDAAEVMLSERKKAESREQSKIICNVIQNIMLSYNMDTKEVMDCTYEEIEEIRNEVRKIKDDETRNYYENILNEMEEKISLF